MGEVLVKEKVLVNKEIFKNAVNNISKAVPRKSPAEILKCIYITIDNDKMTLEAEDGRNRVKNTIDIESNAKIEMLIEADILTKLVGKLKGETIEFTIDEEQMILNLKNGKYKCKIKFMDSNDYPSASKKSFHTIFKITSIRKELLHSLKKSLVSVSTDTSRPVLNGIKLVLEASKEEDFDSHITIYSLDGFRMTKDKININPKHLKTTIKDNIINSSVIIPTESVKIIISTIESIPNDEGVILCLGEDAISVYSTKEKVLSITMQGTFPDCDKLIKLELSSKKINVNRVELKEAIERATLLTENTKNNLVTLTMSRKDETITISTQSDKSKSSEEIEINEIEKFEDDTIKIGFNSRYLLQALSLFDDENVTLNLSTKINPVYFTDSSNTIHLVLPVRTRD